MRGLTLIDLLIACALAAVVASVLVPRGRVDRVVDLEDEAIAVLADLDERMVAHRGSGATDVDGDRKGEYATLGAILGERESDFTRVEGTDTWKHAGYYYAVRLPGPEKSPVRADGREVVPDFAEVAYVIVAWPVEPGVTGMRAYARRPDGLMQHTIDGYPYGGADDPPLPPGDMVKGRRENPRASQRPQVDDWAVPIFETR